MQHTLLLLFLPLQVILGNNAYPATPNLLKMYKDHVTWDQETQAKRRHFNRLMVDTRVTAEQALGSLKHRFRCLMVPLPFKHDKCIAIILACICLHNFII